ncbi:hypothetical protein ACFYNO_13425 [Kitasatospora sp. NPDC006697]|uniref:hypothetical protein n=1 Tax=Kitasatospora sp. NPDC006697 TaxID=3364020 RepID=UPI0036A08F2E
MRARRGEVRGAALCGAAVLVIDCSTLWAVWSVHPAANSAGQLTVGLLLLVGVGAGLGALAAGYRAGRVRLLRCAAEGALLVHLVIPFFFAISWAFAPSVPPW